MAREEKKTAAEEMPEWARELKEHPAFLEAAKKKEAELLAKREEAVREIARLEEEKLRALAAAEKKAEEAEKKYKVLKAEIEAASGEWNRARGERMSSGSGFDAGINSRRQFLQETAPSTLEEAKLHFQKVLDNLRRPGAIDRIALGSTRDIISWTKKVRQETNIDSVHAALKYAQEAIRTLEEWKTTRAAVSPEEIQKLKDGLPSISEYREVEGEKPLPNPALENIALGRAKDEAQTQAINNLLKEADALLARPAPPKPAPPAKPKNPSMPPWGGPKGKRGETR